MKKKDFIKLIDIKLRIVFVSDIFFKFQNTSLIKAKFKAFQHANKQKERKKI